MQVKPGYGMSHSSRIPAVKMSYLRSAYEHMKGKSNERIYRLLDIFRKGKGMNCKVVEMVHWEWDDKKEKKTSKSWADVVGGRKLHIKWKKSAKSTWNKRIVGKWEELNTQWWSVWQGESRDSSATDTPLMEFQEIGIKTQRKFHRCNKILINNTTHKPLSIIYLAVSTTSRLRDWKRRNPSGVSWHVWISTIRGTWNATQGKRWHNLHSEPVSRTT